jgi:SAM-dependent methyltransferase
MFKKYGHNPRFDVRCPVCGSVERHRLTWQFFVERTDLFDGKRKRMLHVAPEPEFERQLRRIESIEYISLDAQDEGADVQMDLTAMTFPDDHFHVIHCSHVLEHVDDDRKAMSEMARVLAPDGWATILVPIFRDDETFEDPSVIDPEERARLFGQWDHVRAYGPDFPTRLEEAGFDVTVVTADDLVPDPATQERYRFAGEALYYCRKRVRGGRGGRRE